MAETTVIKAELRDVKGSAASRRLRRAGIIPAVVCIKDGDSISIQLNQHDFNMMLRHHQGDSLIADLEIGGKKSLKVLLSEVQRDSVTDQTEHADFLEVAMNQMMHVKVPLELIGEPAGLQQGGVLEHGLRELEIAVLPGDMVESIEADISGLNIGDSLLVSDIPLSKTLTILTDAELPIASVNLPRAEEEEEEAEEGAAEGAEPEVIGGEKAEEEGGAENG
jgi:large subunit ribosomal protein L25